MSTPLQNILCIKKAADMLGIPYTVHDKNGNVVSLHLDKNYFFVNYATPFNSNSVSKITRDKEFSYQLLHACITMPYTVGFFDPQHDDIHYRQFISEKTHEEIVDALEKRFHYPLIIKMNHGSGGNNVSMCTSRIDAIIALQNIFNKRDRHYDYVAIAQKYILIQEEYRVIVFRKRIILVYKKDSNLPVSWFESHACIQITQRLLEFIKPIFDVLDIEYAGLDIVVDHDDKLWLLELNSHPGFAFFESSERQALLVNMYTKILLEIKQ